VSIANTAIVGAIWNVVSRLGARVIGLVATLVITRFISPEVMGEVGVAIVAVATAHFASDLAFGQYVVVKSKDNQKAVFHALVFTLIGVTLVTAVLLLLAGPVGDALGAKEMRRYAPIMAMAMAFERIGRIPASVALRDLRFKLFASVSAISELVYAVVAVTMAAKGFGGDSIVWANVAQWGLWAIWLGLAVKPGLWLKPFAITMKETRRLLRFGIPIAMSNVAHDASYNWDRLVITHLFGARVHGIYGLGKRLSAVPADNVGDAVSDVLIPSFVRMGPEESRKAVVRACHLVAILVYPMAAGLAAISPTLVQTLFTPEWYEIALPLTILASVSLIDPMGDTMTSYLKARDMPWSVMLVQVTYLAVLLGSMYVLGYFFGLVGACAGVGVGMFYRAMAGLYIAYLRDNVSMTDMLSGLTRVALASGVMAMSVVGIRELVTGDLSSVHLALGIEIAVGAISYPIAAFALAGPIARDVVKWVREKRAGSDNDEDDSDKDD
jgi:PST family polysaccharide transporter